MSNVDELIEKANDLLSGITCCIDGYYLPLGKGELDEEAELRVIITTMGETLQKQQARIEELENQLTMVTNNYNRQTQKVNKLTASIDDAQVDYCLNEIKGHRAFRDPDEPTDKLLDKCLTLIERLAREKEDLDIANRAGQLRTLEMQADIERLKAEIQGMHEDVAGIDI